MEHTFQAFTAASAAASNPKQT